MEDRHSESGRVALIGDVGRASMRLALTDDAGRLRLDTVRAYESANQPTISGAITTFGREAGLARLPSRCAIAVAGVPRGDAVSITHSRWILSRSGLASLLKAPPLILNDFAAHAWALTSTHFHGAIDALGGVAARPSEAGSYCIIGIGGGLGVALVARDERGLVQVTPTEAGHSTILAGMPELSGVAPALAARTGCLSGETVLSEAGLFALYQAVAGLRNLPCLCNAAPDLIGNVAQRARDPAANEAFELFARALWYFAGNLVLAYGAWDGVIITGHVAEALRSLLRRPELAEGMAIKGPFQRRLTSVPRSLVSIQHAELEGAAVALLMEDERQKVVATTAH